jgi:hypothetical protein
MPITLINAVPAFNGAAVVVQQHTPAPGQPPSSWLGQFGDRASAIAYVTNPGALIPGNVWIIPTYQDPTTV